MFKMKYEICPLGPLCTNLTCLPLYDPMKPHEPDVSCLTQHSHCIENFFGGGALVVILATRHKDDNHLPRDDARHKLGTRAAPPARLSGTANNKEDGEARKEPEPSQNRREMWAWKGGSLPAQSRACQQQRRDIRGSARTYRATCNAKA